MSSGGSNRAPRRDQRRPRNLVPVGRFFGVPLYFAPSWLLIALVITLLYSRVIDDVVPGLPDGMPYLLAFAYAVLLALSILLHELGHVAVSLALKLPVNRVTIFLLGGISEIDREPDRPRDEFLVAIVGPVVSILLAGLAYLGYRLATPNTVGWVTLGLLAFSNLLVGVFNLLPGLPLDGGRVVRALVWGVSGRRVLATQVAAWAGRVVAIAIVVVSVAYFWRRSGIESIVFAALLAGFIWLGATQSLRVAALQARIPTLRLAELVRPAIAVPAATPLAEALRQTWDRAARAIVVANSAGQPQAIVAEAAVAAVPVERRPWMSVADVAAPLAPGSVLPETLEGETLLQAVQSHPAGEYLVVRVDGSTVGVLAAADLAARLTNTPGTIGAGGNGSAPKPPSPRTPPNGHHR